MILDLDPGLQKKRKRKGDTGQGVYIELHLWIKWLCCICVKVPRKGCTKVTEQYTSF